MVTINVKKITTTCLSVIGHLFVNDTITVAATDKEW